MKGCILFLGALGIAIVVGAVIEGAEGAVAVFLGTIGAIVLDIAIGAFFAAVGAFLLAVLRALQLW